MESNIPFKSKKVILALGPESAGNYSVYKNGHIFLSDDFGDLTDANNFKVFKSSVSRYLKKNNIKPDVIMTDLHPHYVTTVWGAELAKRYKAKLVQVQHHIAHVFSAIGGKFIDNYEPACRTGRLKIDNCFGIACDGTGYGEDKKIWGGEIFELKIKNHELRLDRIGHLENQIMIGGDSAVKEPARMLIAILAKMTNEKLRITNNKSQKDFIFKFVNKYYTFKQFEVLYSQFEQNFNCLETSSTGRILDAVSLLLGFCGNKRNYKHEPIELLERNSTKPYKFTPLIKEVGGIFILETTTLFQYLVKNLSKDKKRLAATAQKYIADGLLEMVNLTNTKNADVYFAGGMANNKIISEYLEKQGIYISKKIPRGDAGLSFGQIIYYLTDSRD